MSSIAENRLLGLSAYTEPNHETLTARPLS